MRGQGQPGAQAQGTTVAEKPLFFWNGRVGLNLNNELLSQQKYLPQAAFRLNGR